MELLPEIEYFRDIVFHSKHSVSRKADIPSDVAQDFTWLPHHATLTWTTRPLSIEDNTPVYNMTAFRKTVQEFIEVDVQHTSSGS